MNDSRFPSEKQENTSDIPFGVNETESADKEPIPSDDTVGEPCPEEICQEEISNEETSEEPAEETDGDEQSDELPQNTTEKTLSFVYDLTELFAISFAVVIVILCFFLRHSPVSGDSMEQTIQDKDTLLVSNLAYTPERGDVVIVQSLHNLSKPLVKRVIAVGGDTISINFSRWLIMINGEVYEQRFDENGNEAVIGGDYVYYREGHAMSGGASMLQMGFKYDPNTDMYTATVPEGHLFILGDNRLNSKDSRDPSVGFVDERLVVGKSSFRLTPFSKMGFLE